MKFGDYVYSKAIELCFSAIAAILWGLFAFFIGAKPVLLWGSELFFVAAVVFRLCFGFLRSAKRLKKIERLADGAEEKYLLGEMLETPSDAVEREYYEIVRTISASAIGCVEDSRRDKEDYCNYVERWIHEIKTPLTACSLILDNGGDIRKLKRELKRADNLTETILYYARLRTPEADNVIGKISVAEIAGEAIKSQRELLIAAGIGVEANGDFSVFTDGKALGFIFKQLLINHAKYCPGCHVNFGIGGGKIVVTDNGPGISSHELPRILSRGFTGGERKGGSTGMGLYIVSELCKRLGIELDIRSEVGKGTSFTLCFPQSGR